jgi:hypothetical protein
MCAEQDPITCHRTILICRNLQDVHIKHILGSGKLEEHKDSEQRLLKLMNLHHPDMFFTKDQRLDQAYIRQGKKIAYESIENIDKELEQ